MIHAYTTDRWIDTYAYTYYIHGFSQLHLSGRRRKENNALAVDIGIVLGATTGNFRILPIYMRVSVRRYMCICMHVCWRKCMCTDVYLDYDTPTHAHTHTHEGGREGGRERVLHKKKSSNCATFTSTFQQA